METNSEAEQLFSRLMSAEAEQQPSDTAPPEELLMELPPWYDDRLYKRGQDFYHRHSFALSSSMMYGLVAVFAIPSIIRVLTSTRRSNSPFTAYRRYLSTVLHTMSWFEHDLKPGTTAWRSLEAVRSRHIRASMGAKAKGMGIVSQRDVSFTLFGFMGFSIVKPDAFGVRQEYDDDWEGYNHFWRVIAHMIGLKEEFCLARETIDETREACQLVLERVFTPCMTNMPEYFEHSARVMLDGLWSFNPTIDVEGHLWWSRYLADVPGFIYSENDRVELQKKIKRQLGGNPLDAGNRPRGSLVEGHLWWSRYLADVPGFIYSENDRVKLQKKIKQQLGGNPLDAGVETTQLMQKTTIKGLPDLPPRKLYYNDYNSVENTPEYKRLSFKSKTKIFFNHLCMILYTTSIGRWYFNLNYKFSVFLMRHFPYLSFFRFGFKLSFVNIFTEDLKDDTKLIPNSHYVNAEIKETPWYERLLIFFW